MKSGFVAIIGKPNAGKSTLLNSLVEGKIFNRPTKVIWECANCGYRVETANAPAKCPVCDHPQAYFFELQEQF